MTKVYGGLSLENLVKEDKYFEFQTKLFELGLIHGIQLRVAHPTFTPDITVASLPKVLAKLPENFELFINFGAENVGVDFGRNLDECGVFAENAIKTGISWANWNQETLLWGLQVAYIAAPRINKNFPLGVVHPGYGQAIDDYISYNNIVSTLKRLGKGVDIALENVPAIVDKKIYSTIGKVDTWKFDRYWGFGGTPEDMAKLLKQLGPSWRCLIDFTHLIVTVNQANSLNESILYTCRELEHTIEAYLELPHWPICHFSGIPPEKMLVDNHDFIKVQPYEVLRKAIRQMEVVCLEISFQPDKSEETLKEIETFCEYYLS